MMPYQFYITEFVAVLTVLQGSECLKKFIRGAKFAI